MERRALSGVTNIIVRKPASLYSFQLFLPSLELCPLNLFPRVRDEPEMHGIYILSDFADNFGGFTWRHPMWFIDLMWSAFYQSSDLNLPHLWKHYQCCLYCIMAGNLFSWIFRPNPASPTMAQPSERTLWCAFSDDLQRPFPVDCTLDVDTIAHVKKKKKRFGRTVSAISLRLITGSSISTVLSAQSKTKTILGRRILYISIRADGSHPTSLNLTIQILISLLYNHKYNSSQQIPEVRSHALNHYSSSPLWC